MNWLDAVVLLILVIPTFIGFKRGLAGTVIPLVGIITAIVLAGIFYGAVADWLSSWLESTGQAKIASFIILFVLFIAGGLVLLSLLRRVLRIFRSGWGEMTKTVLPLAGIILGLALAGLFYSSFADWLSSWLESRNQASVVAFLIIFILVMVASIELFFVMSSITGKPSKLPYMGLVDRIGGVVLGLAIGGIIAGAILTLIAKYSSPGMEDILRDSGLAAFFLDHFPFILQFLPDEFDTVRQFFD